MTTTAYDSSNAWSEKELAALDDIKQAVIESCSLHYPDERKTLVIETDASDYGWGSVLYQIGEVKVIEPIAFMGRKFSDAALKWYTYKKECYSEYASMKAYEDYIYGRWFYVYNDHQNLHAEPCLLQKVRQGLGSRLHVSQGQRRQHRESNTKPTHWRLHRGSA